MLYLENMERPKENQETTRVFIPEVQELIRETEIDLEKKERFLEAAFIHFKEGICLLKESEARLGLREFFKESYTGENSENVKVWLDKEISNIKVAITIFETGIKEAEMLMTDFGISKSLMAKRLENLHNIQNKFKESLTTIDRAQLN